jgi:dUTP pyrophosphatase
MEGLFEMKVIQVKVKKLVESAQVPRYAHTGENGDLAADLFSIESKRLAFGDVATILTGIAIELPAGFGAIVADRSGLALMTTLAGVVDPGYRGELKIVVAYLGREPLLLEAGERIAQLRFVERIEGQFEEVTELAASSRDVKGFGSTGR